MELTEFKINLEFVEIVDLERVEVRAHMPDIFDSYRVMFVMPRSLFRASAAVTKMVEDFAVELARQWLADGGMTIIETRVYPKAPPGTTTN